MQLTDYRALGRSGLAVSPLALGTMTFGAGRWGVDEAGAGAILDAFLEAGGNAVDTADIYAGGEGERMLGRLVRARGLRGDVVLATKSGFAAGRGPHRGGNGRKHVMAALEGSLARLGTDHVDLLWLHVWDGMTPPEEVMETMAAVIRSGKARYWALSDWPAWQAARVATLAQAQGVPGPVAFQMFYSLVNRDVEEEHLPLARDVGMGMMPWSPLAFGLLTGKYDRRAVEARGPVAGGLPSEGGPGASPGAAPAGGASRRLDGANPFGDALFTARNWGIVDALREVAAEAGEPMARVALAWLLGRPGVTAPLVGASGPEQLRENLAALALALDPAHRARLDAASAPRDARPAANPLFAGPLRD